VLATLTTTQILQSGLVYTVWLHGLANPLNTTDKLAVDIATNAYYY
jgi:hypothetical protein